MQLCKHDSEMTPPQHDRLKPPSHTSIRTLNIKLFQKIHNLATKLRTVIPGKPSSLERLMKNSLYLLFGNGVVLVVTLASTVLVARALGTRGYGIIVLIQTYVLIVDRVFNFQSWQMLIKYGAEALEANDTGRLKGYLKAALLLDLSSAMVSIVIANILIDHIYKIIGIEAEYIWVLRFYSLIIIFNLIGTPTAILRLFNRFRLYAIYQFVLSSARISAILVVFLGNPSIENFLFAYATAEITGSLFLMIAGAKTLSDSGVRGVLSTPLSTVGRKFREMSHFALTTNLNGTLRMLSREMDTLLVGSVLGNATVGVYKITKQVASLPIFITDPMYNAIYPEFSCLWASGDRDSLRSILRKMLKYSAMFSVVIWLGFYLFGGFFLDVVFGEAYRHAYWPVLLYMLAVLIGASTFPFTPAMLAVGDHSKMLWILIFSTIIYFVFLYGFSVKGGLKGAAISYLFFYTPWSLLVMQCLRKRKVI